MKVLVDTSVWSLSFRKKNKTDNEKLIIDNLKELIKEYRVKIIGPIRQEILSGIKDDNIFIRLKENLKYFVDDDILTEDYEMAADYFNQCREKGIQGSHVDYLICAVVKRKNYLLFTLDNDFVNYDKIIGVRLYKLK